MNHPSFVWTAGLGIFLFCLVGKASVTYRDVDPIIKNKCATCHRGPFLDLTRYPFSWDQSTSQSEIVEELIFRIQEGSMPPPNGISLTPEEIRLLQAWRTDGLQP